MYEHQKVVYGDLHSFFFAHYENPFSPPISCSKKSLILCFLSSPKFKRPNPNIDEYRPLNSFPQKRNLFARGTPILPNTAEEPLLIFFPTAICYFNIIFIFSLIISYLFCYPRISYQSLNCFWLQAQESLTYSLLIVLRFFKKSKKMKVGVRRTVPQKKAKIKGWEVWLRKVCVTIWRTEVIDPNDIKNGDHRMIR